MKTSLNGLLFLATTTLTTSALAVETVNNDYWRITSNVYMELEKFEATIIPAAVRSTTKPP